MDCRDAFHAVLYLYYYIFNEQSIAEYEEYWLMVVSIINSLSVNFTSIFSVFSVMAGWVAEMLFMLFFAYNAV